MYKLLILLLLPLTLLAHMNIAVSYPYIGAITKSIGGEHIITVVLARGNWDPHFVVPRPSLISKVRRADKSRRKPKSQAWHKYFFKSFSSCRADTKTKKCKQKRWRYSSRWKSPLSSRP